MGAHDEALAASQKLIAKLVPAAQDWGPLEALPDPAAHFGERDR